MDGYESDLNQVVLVLEEFLKPSDELYQSYYFIKCLQTYIKILIDAVSEKDKNGNIKISELNNSEIIKKKNWFINVIQGFENMVPKVIKIISIEKFILSLFYKYYLKVYKDDTNIWITAHYLMLGNEKLKQIMKNYEFNLYDKDEDKQYQTLFNKLLYYKGNFEVKITEDKNIEIALEKEKYNINNKNNRENLIKSLEMNSNYLYGQIKKEYSDVKCIYYYPKEFYSNKNIYQIFWLYNLYLDKIYLIDKEEIKKVLPPELYELNEDIDIILNKKENLWHQIKDKIVKNGYKLFEGLENINDNIKYESQAKALTFNPGIDLFGTNEEENIYKALEYIREIEDIIKREIEDIINIGLFQKKKKLLENRNIYYSTMKLNQEIKAILNSLYNDYNKLQNDGNFNYIMKKIKIIEEDIKNNNNNEEIKERMEKLKSEIYEILESQRKPQIKYDNTNNSNNTKIVSRYKEVKPSKSIEIFNQYCKLRQIIDIIKNKKNSLDKRDFVSIIQEFCKYSEKPIFFFFF